MNKKRRKSISDIISVLDNVKGNIEDILSDEEYYFDNMPENLQGSIRGEESEEAIDLLTDAIESINDCIENLTEII